MDPDGPEPDQVDVVAASVATYSDHVELFTAFSAAAAAAPFARFAAQLSPGSTVLDAGCGPGRDLARLAALGHRGVGVDLNGPFSAPARAHAPIARGDLRALPLASCSFDAVWASASLIHLPGEQAARALRELSRVARPGAPVHVSVKTAGATGWAEDMPTGRRWFHIWTADAFSRAVAEAGFSVHEVTHERGWVTVSAGA